MRCKSQVSVEYLMLIGFALLVALPLFYYAITESSNSIKLNQAEDAVNTIAKAADSVYSLGPGTKKYADVMFPGGIEEIYISNKTVRLKISIFGESADIYSKTKASLQGSLPASSGLQRVFVEALDSGVVEVSSLTMS